MIPHDYKELYESEDFKQACIQAGTQFGAFYEPQKTTFRVFAVNADAVSVRLHRTGTDEEKNAGKLSELSLTCVSPYVYEGAAEGDLEGIYYEYAVLREGERHICADPWGRACGANGKRSMVADLRKTDPKGWDKDVLFRADVDHVVISELHVRDFSEQGLPGVREAYRGKFMAFEERGKRMDGYTVGLPYYKRLGITHLHLLPIFDYASVDETNCGDAYNWGYDPENYNVPEGSYATDPYDGHVRIRECKRMIKAIHDAGIGVVMDVVYNHTYSSDGAFQILAPYYYYRQNADGSLSNGSACGNETASERYGVGNFILQSVLYWAKEYHIDGFRFDLMGLHDTDTMNRIREALDEAFPDKPILMYGEPWAAAESPMEPGFFPAVKSNVERLHDGIAIFNDNTRDVIKGSVFYGEIPGFVNGAKGLEQAVASAVLAWCDGGHDFSPKSPAQCINYVSVHDNYTLWDKLCITAGKSNFEESDEMLLKQNRLAAGIVFTCMGTPLFQAGEEFARTKLGEENSYCASPGLNRLDWKRREAFDSLTEYYRGLIALRRKIAFYADKTPEALSHVRILQAAGENVVFLIDNASYDKKGFGRIWICYHAGREAAVLPLPEGKWSVLADGTSSFLWKRGLLKKRKQIEKEVRVEPVSLKILGSRAE